MTIRILFALLMLQIPNNYVYAQLCKVAKAKIISFDAQSVTVQRVGKKKDRLILRHLDSGALSDLKRQSGKTVEICVPLEDWR